MKKTAAPVLTRRGFLHQLGAVGGSSLVMTAMSSWDLMAGPAGQRPELTGRPAKARVLVLGAGLSGLVVGHELGKLGYDYRILEARDRVGGLQWSVRRGTEHTEAGGGERQVCAFDEGHYINVGPWRIPHSHAGVLSYCRELGVPLQVFLNESDALALLLRRHGRGVVVEPPVRLREVKADMAGEIDELLIKAIDQQKLDLPLSADDQKLLTDFLVNQGYLDANTRTYKAFVNRGEGDPYQLTALLQAGFGNRLRSVPAMEGTMAAPMFQPVGGMDEIAKGFQRAMAPGRITFNAEIQSVHQGEAGVKVVYLDTRNKQKSELAADYVVACLPLNILAGIDVNLSTDVMQAVKDIPYSNSAKIGLAMKRRFWEEDDHIYRRSSLLEPAARRVLVSVLRLLHEEGRPARPLRERPGRQPDRPADRGADRARPDAREQGAPTDSGGVRERLRGVLEEGPVQPGRLRHGQGRRPQRQAAAGGQPDHHRVGGRHATLGAGLAGRGGRSRLARADLAARTRDARVAVERRTF